MMPIAEGKRISRKSNAIYGILDHWEEQGE